MAFGAWAETETVGDYTWTYYIKGETASILGISPEPMGTVIIPSTLDGKPVAHIGNSALFYGCNALTSVTIPEGVSRIGASMFSGCTSLMSVTIPDSVTSIDNFAFYGCNALTSVTIPDGVTSIGYEAFYGCSLLTDIVIPDSVTSIRERAFDGTPFNDNQPDGFVIFGRVLYTVNGMCPDSVVIPEGVSSIGAFLFSRRTNLTSVTIPDSVISIGDSAFSGCSALTSIAIPDGVTSIDGYVFSGCTALASVTIPDNVTNISVGAFAGCNSLTNIVIPRSVVKIESSAFYGGNGLLAFDVDEANPSYKSVSGLLLSKDGTTLFAVPGGMMDVTIPESVTSIGSDAFSSCRFLTHVTIPDSVITIGNHAFSGCNELLFDTSTLPGVKLVDGWAVGYVKGLRDLDLAGVRGIGAGAFDDCASLTNVTISGSVKHVGSSAFYGCDALMNVMIEDGVESFGYCAFSECNALTSVVLPASVTNIGSAAAFTRCGGMMSYEVANDNPSYKSVSGLLLTKDGNTLVCGINGGVTIPDGVTSIGHSAFSGCSGLTSVAMPDSVASIGYRAFEGCSGLTSVTMPDSVASIGYRAFEGCSGLTSVTMPDSVMSIGVFTFSDCCNLSRVIFEGDAPYCMWSFTDVASNCVAYVKRDSVGWGVDIPGEWNGIYIEYIDAMTDPVLESLFEWRVVDDKVEITKYIGDESSITVPSSIEGIPVVRIGFGAFQYCLDLKNVVIPDSVTTIGSSAFYGCSGLTSVSIPDSVTSIGDWAFYGCSGLTSVSIPDSVTSIGSSAFYNCICLTSVTIPDSVTSIGYGAFSGCSGLMSISVGSENANYKSVNGLLLSKDGKTLIRGLTSVSIPDSVTRIGDCAFEGYSGLTSVTIPDSVTSIGYAAFLGCSGLTSVTIPDSVTSIGDEAFFGCSDSLFDTTTIPGVKLVDGWAIGHADSISGSLNLTGVRGIGYYAFSDCSGLASVTIPNSVTSIGDGVFCGCSGLTSVTIPDSVTSIGNEAFFGCSDSLFDTTTIPGVKLVDGWAIGHADSISGSLNLTGVRGVGYEAFSCCRGLKSVTIGNGVRSIGDSAFYGCCDLASVTIGNGVRSIGDSAFYGCCDLASVTIPDSVTCIGDSAFSCSGLTSVTIPDAVKSIGDSAFAYCSGLTSVTIPDSVTSIGDYAFYCGGLMRVTMHGDCPFVGTEAFGFSDSSCVAYLPSENSTYNIVEGKWQGMIVEYNRPRFTIADGVLVKVELNNMTKITIPDSVRNIGDHAFESSGNHMIKHVIIPDSVTNIGCYAFSGCISLRHLEIPDSVSSIGFSAFSGCCDDLFDLETISGVALVDGWVVGCTDSLAGDLCLTDMRGIAIGAFSGCGGITNVVFSSGLKRIPAYAFFACTNLEKIVFSTGLKTIGSGAFAKCTKLKDVILPSTLIALGDKYAPLKAYGGDEDACVRFTSYAERFLSDGTNFLASAVGLEEFHDSDYDFEEINEGSAYTEAETHATNETFTAWGTICGESEGCELSCDWKTTSSHSYHVSRVGETNKVSRSNISNNSRNARVEGAHCAMGVFEGCEALESVLLHYGLREIGAGTFKNCTSLKSLRVPDTVISIGGHAESVEGCFEGSVSTVSDLLEMNDYKPNLCTSDQAIDNVSRHGTYKGSGFLQGCSGLTNAMLSANLGYLGPYSFAGCANLVSIRLPDSLCTLNEGTFSGCAKLETVVLPKALDLVGGYEFTSQSEYFYCRDTLAINGSHPSTLSTEGTIITQYDADGGVLVVDTLINNGGTPSAITIYSKTNIVDNADGTFTVEGLLVDNGMATNLVTYVAEYDDIDFDNRWQDGVGTIFVPKTIVGADIDVGGRDSLGELMDFVSARYSGTAGKKLSARNRFFPSAPTYNGKTFSPDSGVFSGCVSLKSITLPDTVRRIADYAFYDCAELASVNVPDSLEVVGYDAFGGMTSLPDFNAPWQGNTSTIDDMLSNGRTFDEIASLFAGVSTFATDANESLSQEDRVHIACSFANSVIYALNRFGSADRFSTFHGIGDVLNSLSDVLRVTGISLTASVQQEIATGVFQAATNALVSLTAVDHDLSNIKSFDGFGDILDGLADVLDATGSGMTACQRQTFAEGAFAATTNALVSLVIPGRDFSSIESFEGLGDILWGLAHISCTLGASLNEEEQTRFVCVVTECATSMISALMDGTVLVPSLESYNGIGDVFISLHDLCLSLCPKLSAGRKMILSDLIYDSMTQANDVIMVSDKPIDDELFKLLSGAGECLKFIDGAADDPIPILLSGTTNNEIIDLVKDIAFVDATLYDVISADVNEYSAFREWALKVKGVGANASAPAGANAVVNAPHAAAAFLLGATKLFENEPIIKMCDVSIESSPGCGGVHGTMIVGVAVKDGERTVAVDAAKIAAMFEATSDLGDWGGAALPVTIEPLGCENAAMQFRVAPSSYTAPQVFLRIRQ